MIRFAIIVFCFFLAFHLIAYYALIRAMFKDAKGKIIAGICVVVHFLITAGFAAVLLIFRADIPHFLYATLSTTALNAVLFFTFGIINIVFLIAFRRKIQRQILTSRILFGVSVLCIIFAIFNAVRMPNLTQTTIYLPNLPHESTILMMSDLHLSRLISTKKVEKIIDLANAQNAEVIVLVGDIIDSRPKIMSDFLPILAKLYAKNGVYFALGNHEFIFDAHKSIETIKSLKNITPLVNQSTIIDANYNLIGISDISGIRFGGDIVPDLDSALQGTDANLPKILLSHQPNIIKHIDARRVDLILSGHTHGGQIFPFSIGAYFGNPFLYGLKNMGDFQLYISQGAHLAVTFGRFLSRAEINLITLKNAI